MTELLDRRSAGHWPIEPRRRRHRPALAVRRVIIACLLAAMAAATAGSFTSPVSGGTTDSGPIQLAQQNSANPSAFRQVAWGSTEVETWIKKYRKEHRPGAGRNVAVFRYEDGGEIWTITTASVSKRPKGPREAIFSIRDAGGAERILTVADEWVLGLHSEELIDRQLSNMGIRTDQVDWIHSELEPCSGREHKCAVNVVPRYKNASVTFNFGYPADDDDKRKASLKELRRVVERFPLEIPPFDALYTPMSEEAADILFGPKRVPPGGIDFASLELRYLADIEPGQGANYAMQARVSPDGNISGSGAEATQQASDAFFVWLALPPSSFTVNLNPTKPEDILDAQFARTDAGRILLDADLRLKKTTAALIHPDTDLGGRFWDALQFASGTRRCSSFRTWIHPGTATVRATARELHILEAPLAVSMEAAYLHPDAAAAQGQTACPEQERGIERHNEEVFRTTILPRISEAVNQGAEYQDLRRVYLSRVAAEWVRERSAQQKTAYSGIIDSGDVGRWTARQPWSPQEIYGQYVKSYSEKEFRVTRKTQLANAVETRIRSFGGVDFTEVPRIDVGEAVFRARWSDLSATVDKSLNEIVPGVDGQHLWLGGGTKEPPDDQASGAPEDNDDSISKAKGSSRGGRTGLIIAELLVLTIIVAGWSLVIRRSVRSPSTERRGA